MKKLTKKTTEPQTSHTRYLDMLLDSKSSLESALKKAQESAHILNSRKIAWSNRLQDAENQKFQAKSPEGEKAMSILSEQASRFYKSTHNEHQVKMSYIHELKENLDKVQRVISKLESVKKLSILEEKLARMDSKNDLLAIAEPQIDVNVFNSADIKRLVYEAQALIEITQ